LKIYFFFYKDIFWVNLSLSIALILLLSFSLESLKGFSLPFVSVGFLASFFLASFFNPHKKYLHYNLGISKQRLFFMLFLINLLIGIIFHFIMSLL